MNIERHMAEVMENDAIRSDERVLLDLLSACSPVKRGASWKCLCPVHAERTPSCEVRRGRDGCWRWKCFGCGKGGDAFDLVVAIEGCTFRQARERLGAKRAQLAAPPPLQNQKPRGKRTEEPPPTHVLACERSGCTEQKLVTLVDVAALLDRAVVTEPFPGEFRWVCETCWTLLIRNKRWWALYRLYHAPRRERAGARMTRRRAA